MRPVISSTPLSPPHRSTSTELLEVRSRKSAVPPGAGKVVISIILNRSRVMSFSVRLETALRIESVPKVELLGGADVKERTRFGACVEPMQGSIKLTNTILLEVRGSAKPSGDGAPSR